MTLDLGRRRLAWAISLALVSACGASTDGSVAPAGSTSLPPRTPSPTVEATPPTADAVFERVAQSVAFVATAVGTGSGLVYDDRHVITNAHVVRPFPAARVRLSDGTEVPDAPVVGWDLLADLAVLDVGVAPNRRRLQRAVTTAKTGARVYLVGYPRADVEAPKATITEGIVSSDAVEWVEGLTFLQADATIDDGQSGGVMVDARGDLLGITGASLGAYAMAIDARDAARRIDSLLAGDDVDKTGDHLLPDPDPKAPKVVDVVIRHRADAHVWVIPGGDAPATVKMTSDRSTGLFGLAAAGRLGRAAGPAGTKLQIDMTFDAVGPYAVKLEAANPRGAHATLRSTAPLTEVVDADDGRTIQAGSTLVGAADYGGDIDWYVLSMHKGETAKIRASAVAIDPALFIDRIGDDPAPLATGHDAGGPLGGDDLVTFAAPSDGEYLVVVADARYLGSGAYRLEVDPA